MAKLAIKFPVFRHAPAVTFGRGSVRSLAEVGDEATAIFLSGAWPVQDYVDSALKHGSGGLSKDNSIAKPAGEPTAESIRQRAAFLAGRGVRRIIAVGGGPTIL